MDQRQTCSLGLGFPICKVVYWKETYNLSSNKESQQRERGGGEKRGTIWKEGFYILCKNIDLSADQETQIQANVMQIQEHLHYDSLGEADEQICNLKGAGGEGGGEKNPPPASCWSSMLN